MWILKDISKTNKCEVRFPLPAQIKTAMTIELNEEQTKRYNGVIQLCCNIEKEMHVTVDPTIPEQVQQQLSNLLPYLSNLSDMVSISTAIYDWAKGKVADEIIGNSLLLEAKQGIQSNFIQGRLAKYNALYSRVESISKNLRSSVDGLRSLLSYEKELARINQQQEH